MFALIILSFHALPVGDLSAAARPFPQDEFLQQQQMNEPLQRQQQLDEVQQQLNQIQNDQQLNQEQLQERLNQSQQQLDELQRR